MAGAIAMRVLRGGLSAAALLLALALQAQAADGLVYRLSRDGAPPSYLIGTMHSEDPRVTALLDAVAPLIEQTEVVALEMLPDAVTLLAVGAATLLPQEQSLHRMIGAERFEALKAAAAIRRLPPELVDRLKPWAAAVMLGMPAADTGRFLDLEIYVHAVETQRRAVGLETAAEQLAVFERMPLQAQLLLLDEMIKNAHELPKQLETLTDAYLAGDLERLAALAREQYGDMPPVVREWFDEVLIRQRNQRMLARLLPLLDEGPVFIAVGALHLAGENGLLAGLRRKGLKVQRCCD